jgi:hypothetical protein
MSVFTRVLRAGEGKKVRRLAEIIPMINALEAEMEASATTSFGTRPSSSASGWTRARPSTICWWRPLRWCERAPGGCSASGTSMSS